MSVLLFFINMGIEEGKCLYPIMIPKRDINTYILLYIILKSVGYPLLYLSLYVWLEY